MLERMLTVKIKMGRRVSIKFFLMDWFYYNLIILINAKSHIKIWTKLYCFRETRFFSEKLKTLTSSNYHGVQYFLLKFRSQFLLTSVYKKMFGIFSILFRSWVICKNKKHLGSTHSFTFLLITQDLKKSRALFCRYC